MNMRHTRQMDGWTGGKMRQNNHKNDDDGTYFSFDLVQKKKLKKKWWDRKLSTVNALLIAGSPILAGL